MIDADAFSRMKTSAYLISAARGRCVDEPALIKALQDKMIAGAGIDVTVEEPLQRSSPLWDFANVLITPHTAGETRRYEENVLDILTVRSHSIFWRRFTGAKRNRLLRRRFRLCSRLSATVGRTVRKCCKAALRHRVRYVIAIRLFLADAARN